jgi:hypothetical protein
MVKKEKEGPENCTALQTNAVERVERDGFAEEHHESREYSLKNTLKMNLAGSQES